MQQAESQLQLRVQELDSVRESLAEAQAAAAAVTSDRDALRQALSNQDKAMQAMKAYVGSMAAAPAPAPPPRPPSSNTLRMWGWVGGGRCLKHWKRN